MYITICITYYKRPESLKRCLASLPKNVPHLVQDTEGNLSRGRNILMERCATPYAILMEEDMEFCADTDINKLVSILEQDEEVGLASGIIENDSIRWCHNFHVFRGVQNARVSNDAFRATKEGVIYRTCDLTINFGAIRVEAARKIRWNENLPVGEHREWFARFSREWRSAVTSEVKIKHYSDRPSEEYTKARNRSIALKDVAEKEIGAKYGVIKYRDSIHAELHRRNVVVLGVGHSNTTVTTKQLNMLGWKSNAADLEFAEIPEIRDLNNACLTYSELNLNRAAELLESLRPPWVIKDPRFARGALPYWYRLLLPYNPILVWLQKDLAAVKASHAKRNEEYSYVDTCYENCRSYYSAWPGDKIIINATRLGMASMLFDNNRFEGKITMPAENKPSDRSKENRPEATNPYCECEVAGFCTRHKKNKNEQEFRMCKGIATERPDCGFSFFQAWEKGRHGATPPEIPILKRTWPCRTTSEIKRLPPSDEQTRTPHTAVRGKLTEKRRQQVRRHMQQNQKHVRKQSLVGDFLQESFESKGFRAVKGCDCKRVQAELNAVPVDQIERNLDTYAVKVRKSAKSWQEHKGGMWNVVPAPPLSFFKHELKKAIKKSKEAMP